jgi:hypothetical protein
MSLQCGPKRGARQTVSVSGQQMLFLFFHIHIAGRKPIREAQLTLWNEYF